MYVAEATTLVAAFNLPATIAVCHRGGVTEKWKDTKRKKIKARGSQIAFQKTQPPKPKTPQTTKMSPT